MARNTAVKTGNDVKFYVFFNLSILFLFRTREKVWKSGFSNGKMIKGD